MKHAIQMMNEWLQHRNVLEKLLEQINDEQINFKPWDGAVIKCSFISPY
ncbi:hypothetical protein ACQKP0_13545 [Heyndrickxia sp. NPDC080065]